MKVKKTGGGAFDPADRPVYFAAGDTLAANGGEQPHYVLVAVNELWTDRAVETRLIPHLDAGRNVLLDSGVFWLTNEHKRAHGAGMDTALALAPEQIDGFAGLRARYVDLVAAFGDRLWGYIELDQGGAINKRRTRAGLEAEGLAPIPVYHPLNDGWDYFDELACSYDRICFGNIVQASGPVRARLLHTLWERHRAYPGLWVHVLGFTASQVCLSVPFESCDSSTWAGMYRWAMRSARPETALMVRTKPLGERFRYDQGNPGADGNTQPDSVRMCLDALRGVNLVWRHASTAIAAQSGQAPVPARLPGEPVASR